MRTQAPILFSIFALTLVLPFFAAAQSPAASPAISASAARRETVYRLDNTSGYSAGCINCGSCMIWFTPDFRGSFTLKPTPSAGPFWNAFEVGQINWLVSTGVGEMRVTGSGQLKIHAAAQLQQLTLDLSFNGQPSVAYDSGLQSMSAAFPKLSFGGVQPVGAGCISSNLQIDASPVKPQAYELLGGASYVYGCLKAPCYCAVFLKDLTGSFGLVPLGSYAGKEEFALVNASWDAIGVGAVHGAGIYRFGGGSQEMFGEFNAPGAGVGHYASGLTGGGGLRPIDIGIWGESAGCFGDGFGVLASPK